MSYHRENIIWQSENGTWSIGFYECHAVNTDDEDFDGEWDVEYDHDRFNWVSVGHPSSEAAFNAWDGSNPGGSSELSWSKESAEECAGYDRMAQEKLKTQREDRMRAARYRSGTHW